MRKTWVALLCLLILALPLGAYAEGLEIEYDEVPAVMAVEAPSAEDAKIVAEAAEPAVDEAGEFLLGADEGDAPAKADGQSVMAASDDFEIDDEGVLTGYNGPGGTVVIPNGAYVIGFEAFAHNTTISSVIFHDGVYKIEEGAFRGCSNLASVTFGNGLRAIDGGAFTDTALSDVTLPEGLIGIKEYSFSDCHKLTRIVFPDSLLNIGEYAFENCTSLSSVELPAGLAGISGGTFWQCSGLKSVTISNGVTSIDGDAFNGCTALTEIDIPNSVVTIGQSAFKNTGLRSITLPDKLATVDEYTFEKCVNLTEAHLPDGLLSIRNGAFKGCERLKTINIPAGVTTLGEEIFQDCIVLPGVDLPAGLDSISPYLFDNCKNMADIKLPAGIKSIGEYAFSRTGLTTIELPDGVTGIGDSAFWWCESLKIAYIPASVEVIDDLAFNWSDAVVIQTPCGSYAQKWANEHEYNTNIPSHKKVVTDAAVTPTETTPGKTEGSHCDVCGDVLVAQQNIFATGAIKVTGANVTYDGEAHGISVTVSKPKGAEVCYGVKAGACEDEDSPEYTGAGTYTVYYKVEAEDYVTVETSATLTIAPKTVGLEWTKTSLTYNGKAQKPKATATGLVDDDACKVTVTGKQTNAGKHTATASKLSNANYALPKKNTKAFTIAPKVVGLKWTKTSLTYNGKAQKPKATATGLIKGDKCTVTVTGTRKAAGKGTAKATKLSNANYALPKTVTQAFTVAKKTVGLKWTKTTLTYNGKSQKPTLTLTGLIKGDKCTATVTGARKSAGKGTAKVTKLSNKNYKLPKTVTQAFTINKKTVGLEWTNLEFDYDGKSHKPTATATGLIEGDTCTVTVTGARKSAGTGTAKASRLSNANYKLPKDIAMKFDIVE